MPAPSMDLGDLLKYMYVTCPMELKMILIFIHKILELLYILNKILWKSQNCFMYLGDNFIAHQTYTRPEFVKISINLIEENTFHDSL